MASNKVVERYARKLAPLTTDVQQMSGGPKNLNALAEG
jgi:hypothetical protein